MPQDSAWTHYYNQQQQAGLIPAAAAAQPNFAPASQHYQTIPGAVGVPQQIHHQAQQQMAQPQQQQQQVTGGNAGNILVSVLV